MPTSSNGFSTGHAPIYVKIRNSLENTQKKYFLIGKNFFDVFFTFIIVRRVSDIIDMPRANTPPSLFGMERRIAYANRKYHSGWICGGVFSGLAGLKFSGSPPFSGFNVDTIIKVATITNKVTISFIEKYGWNIILSVLGFVPLGRFEPDWCKEARCEITMAVKMSGRRKCRVKNRFKVATPIENPPHSHWTICLPTMGIADNKLVITVAPQKDICPHGST